MDFGKFDIVILLTMSLAIIFMSFTFPALGLADSSNETATDDIPEFNITSGKWDIAGDFPNDPGTPSQGELTFDDQAPGNGVNSIFLDGDTSGGTELVLLNVSSKSQIRVNNWSGGSVAGVDKYNTTAEGDTHYHDNGTYEIAFETTEYDSNVTGDPLFSVEWEIRSQDPDQSWIERIPIVGGIYSTGEALASIVGWIGSVIWWAVATSFEIALTVVGTLFDVMVYTVDMMHWLTTTYLDIITEAGTWAAVVLMVPAILLFLEFGKLGMLGIKLLPFT